jgi:putative tryptophan/tyrosine transport system substrate-binding protein
MKRREFIWALGGAAVARPLAARAQQPKVWRIGVLETISQSMNAANFEAFRRGLRELGYIEGQNLIIDYRSADGRAERFPGLAADFVRLQVDVIVTRGTPAGLAAKNATTTIPIVMAAMSDPVGVGAVDGLARPGGNITGLAAFSSELEPKRVELLKEMVPGLTRVAVLFNMSNPVFLSRWEMMKTATQSLHIKAQLLDVRRPEDLGSAFEAAARQRADALVCSTDAFIQANRHLIVELAAKSRLPSIYGYADFADTGGLMSYSVNYPDLYFRAAGLVAKILNGTRPGDLPVEQPTKFKLVINLKTAKALGLDVPDRLLTLADEVIE